MSNADTPYDAILVVSFGGPEGPDDVMPFLENVLRGRNVPRERMLEVAEHYYHFGGVSPINAQNRALIAALEVELKQHGPHLPIYWGNRNWHPLLPDTLRQMADNGVKRAVAFFTSAFSSYSGCRQYRENILAAQTAVGPGAPQIDKLRVFYNHPGFIEAMLERIDDALQQVPVERRDSTEFVFTAHSIPCSMASNSNYEKQLNEACGIIMQSHRGRAWRLVFQSRSGPPTQPWLEPDVGDYLRQTRSAGTTDVVLVPLGFVSDHMEVLFDLDYEAKHIAEEIGLNLVRAGTVGVHPKFVSMIRELIAERLGLITEKRALGPSGPSHDVCPVDCCPAPQRPSGPPK